MSDDKELSATDKELQRQQELFRRTLIIINVSVILTFIGTLCLILFFLVS